MIRVILWDVDGTLLDFSAAERCALQDCFQRFSLGACDEARVARYSAINEAWWKRLERGEVTKKQLLPGRFREFFAQEGLAFSESDSGSDSNSNSNYETINAFYQEKLGEHIFFIENSAQLVGSLRGRVKQYAVTNGTKTAQDGKLRRSGLGALLDGVFISEVVGAEKPSPAFFDAVLAAVGPYAKDEILIVGDSLTSDMLGGNRAGLLCGWYNPKGLPRPENLTLHYDIRHLDEVKTIVLGE